MIKSVYCHPRDPNLVPASTSGGLQLPAPLALEDPVPLLAESGTALPSTNTHIHIFKNKN